MNVIRLAFGDLRHALRPVLLFALAWAAIQAVLLSPLMSWALGHLMPGRGQLAVSNQEITGFLLSPAGLAFATLTAVSSAALQLGQQSGFQLLAQDAQRRRRVSPLAALRRVLRKLPRLAGLAAVMLSRFALVALPAAGLVVLLYCRLPGGHDINFYLATQPPEWQRTVILAGTVALLAAAMVAYLLLRWMLALPHLVTTGERATACLRSSWRQTDGRAFRLATPLLLWWGLSALAALLLTRLFGAVAGAVLDFGAGRLERTAIALILVEGTAVVAGTLLTALASAISQFIVARIYRANDSFDNDVDHDADEPLPVLSLGWRRLLTVGLGIGMILSLLTTARQLSLVDADVAVQVTAHRGSSRHAPENSLSAVRRAIADGAEFAEIDVQSTRDGEVVVWHDADLMRAVRDPRQIGDCTLAELKVLDVGSHFGPAFANERVATLEEAIHAAGDQIRLNVELKFNRPDPELAARVARVLRRSNFLQRCVVTSLDAAELRRFRELAPEVPVGLTVSISLGDATRLPVDFLSVNSTQAKPSFLDLARRNGKTVHVWTINDRAAALRFMLLGADNLITDEPALLVGLRRELEELDEMELMALALRERLAW